MSLDYTYHMGYGFFVAENDVKDDPRFDDEDDSVYDFSCVVLEDVPDSHLLNIQYAAGMSSSQDRILICLQRSTLEGDAKCPEYDEERPAVLDLFDGGATVEEMAALDSAAKAFGIDMYIPQMYFYITTG